MKTYKLKLPERLEEKNKKNIIEYLMVKHYEDDIFTSGACACVLNIEKYDFQTKVLKKYGIDYTG